MATESTGQNNEKRLFIPDTSTTTMGEKLRTTTEDICLEAGYYLHKKPLGEGGFGKVRLATHLRTNQKVAIKMMNKQKLGQDLQRVRIEIEALKVLQHDNIAKMLQVIETDTDIYLVLEYCSGGELFDYLIAKRRLTETEVRVIMKDLFKVLLYIHNRGFAHRDLKPENILFDQNHKIKLIDFGLAANSSKNKAALSFLQTCCGSPAYAAPELLRGLTYSGPAVDVWSAGILLYSLLVGQLPFDDDNINNLYKKIQDGRFMMPQWLSADVRDLIASMLRSNPADRITVAKALDHRWIRKGFTSVSPSMPTPIPSHGPLSPAIIDQKIFSYLQQLFPRMTDLELRRRLKLFGYVTATYLLLKHDPQAIQAVKESLQLRMKSLAQQQQELSGLVKKSENLIVEPRIAAIKRKLQLDCNDTINSQQQQQQQTDQTEPMTKKVKEMISTPKKTLLLNGINSTTVTPKIPPPLLTERKQMLINSAKCHQSPALSPRVPMRLTPQKARQIKSPKLQKPMNDENSVSIKAKTLVKSPLANNNTNGGVTTIKSPLRDVCNQVLSPTNKQQVKPSPKIMLNTPTKTSSSQKSLLQRLMASATPTSDQIHRKLDTSMPSNNITMTSYKEPQECIDHLIHTLRSKGVDCKQKNFTLKCFFNDKIHSSLKFDLEICQFNGLCVIHRKRLNGDAWNYKKICELILQLSNEQQLAALNNDNKKSTTIQQPQPIETETRV
ncbi:LOW QUALITY PROTEIN: maternal embryonic leucine zipper kinase-like [Dermatophagoides pteronyssinus]|uniref:LOW QUALITY PROTEIN: maternal embryonic leucine zipper kinase-like n=1 Tax=Dermatophagoides pteronyssinus TaxID=6956 RepID=UPI003F6728D5